MSSIPDGLLNNPSSRHEVGKGQHKCLGVAELWFTT